MINFFTRAYGFCLAWCVFRRDHIASKVQKPVNLETSLIINVPLFIKEAKMVKIDTPNGALICRA